MVARDARRPDCSIAVSPRSGAQTTTAAAGDGGRKTMASRMTPIRDPARSHHGTPRSAAAHTPVVHLSAVPTAHHTLRGRPCFFDGPPLMLLI
jgi:hypothetical protein